MLSKIAFSILAISSFAFAGDEFTVNCTKGPELMLQKSKVWLNRATDGTYEAGYFLDYTKQKGYEFRMSGLQCEFNRPAVHCWNSKGQAFNFSEERTTRFDFDHEGPEKFQSVVDVKFNSTFMFHPRPWAESGPDANKYQHMLYSQGHCRLN